MNTDYTDLIANLRDHKFLNWGEAMEIAADALAAQQREIERLTAVVKAANDQAEHFEREWYLHGHELEDTTAERDALRNAAKSVMARLQMDIDDGDRPDQWSMEYMRDELRAAMAKEKRDE